MPNCTSGPNRLSSFTQDDAGGGPTRRFAWATPWRCVSSSSLRAPCYDGAQHLFRPSRSPLSSTDPSGRRIHKAKAQYNNKQQSGPAIWYYAQRDGGGGLAPTASGHDQPPLSTGPHGVIGDKGPPPRLARRPARAPSSPSPRLTSSISSRTRLGGPSRLVALAPAARLGPQTRPHAASSRSGSRRRRLVVSMATGPAPLAGGRHVAPRKSARRKGRPRDTSGMEEEGGTIQRKKKKKREREHGTERPTALSPQYGDAHPTESGSAEVRRGTKGCKSRDRRAKRRKRRRAGCHVVTNRGKGGLRQTIRQEPRWRCASL